MVVRARSALDGGSPRRTLEDRVGRKESARGGPSFGSRSAVGVGTGVGEGGVGFLDGVTS